ncbi:MAG: hypothetical protein ACYC06_01810 [Ilumatobacteraceae bacterium]
MIIYTAQALCLGVLLWFLAQSSHRTDIFIGVYVCMWAAGVIALYWYFGDAQDAFYSNDQQVQLAILQSVTTNGIQLSLDAFIRERYIVILPALMLTKLGIIPILALKFLQGVCFVLMYQRVKQYLLGLGLKLRPLHLIFFAGPIFMFMSVLALRDVAIAYFALNVLITRDVRLRLGSLGIVGLLRPHLAVALAFGQLVHVVMRRFPPKRHLLLIPMLVVVSYICGNYAYQYGAHVRERLLVDINLFTEVLTQRKFSLILANFAGLQFLAFGERIVHFSIMNLFLLRLIFIDTFVIPLSFIIAMITCSPRLQTRVLALLAAFTFFIGLVSQSEFNSSRQNLPFLVMMGVLVLENVRDKQIEKQINSQSPDKHLDAVI